MYDLLKKHISDYIKATYGNHKYFSVHAYIQLVPITVQSKYGRKDGNYAAFEKQMFFDAFENNYDIKE